jgi:hypothetical protein
LEEEDQDEEEEEDKEDGDFEIKREDRRTKRAKIVVVQSSSS